MRILANAASRAESAVPPSCAGSISFMFCRSAAELTVETSARGERNSGSAPLQNAAAAAFLSDNYILSFWQTHADAAASNYTPRTKNQEACCPLARPQSMKPTLILILPVARADTCGMRPSRSATHQI